MTDNDNTKYENKDYAPHPDHMGWTGEQAGDVLIKKVGSNKWVKMKDLAAQRAKDDEENAKIDAEIRAETTRYGSGK